MQEVNLQDFKNKFIDEAFMLLDSLEGDLLELENNPEDSEKIESAFRALHTLKGVSSMFGFDLISELTHNLENIYEQIKSDNQKLTKEIFDVTFLAIDQMRNLLNADKTPKKEDLENQQEITVKINALSKKLSSELTIDEKVIKEKKKEEIRSTSQTWYIIINLSEKIIFRGIKILYLFQDLSKLGPFQIVRQPFIKEGECDVWGVFLSSNCSQERIREIFIFIEDSIRITRISGHDLFNKETIPQYLIDENLNDEEMPGDTIIGIIDKLNHLKNPELRSLEPNQNIETEEKTPEIKSKFITKRISVEANKLDELMYLVSEMITLNSQFNLFAQDKNYQPLKQNIERLDKLTKQFRNNALGLRLVPINDMVLRFQRLVRDLSKQLGKDAELIVTGGETELDKNTIDILAEPLMHIIRNCLDHGIELPEQRILAGKPAKGTIQFAASHSGSNIIIEIKDDGNGIDIEKVRRKAIEKGLLKVTEKLSDQQLFEFIFLPGFSTAQNLTEVSGRGVGMDIVRRRISETRGEVFVESEKNTGTTFTIKLPLSLSIIDTLLVNIDNTYCCIPLEIIDSCLEDLHIKIEKLPNYQIPVGNELIPFIYLRKEFEIADNIPDIERIVLVNINNKKIGLVVDNVIGQHQAVVKPLGNSFKKLDFVFGGSILGNGDIAFVLDVNKLIKLAA